MADTNEEAFYSKVGHRPDRTIYVGKVRPVLEYGMAATSTTLNKFFFLNAEKNSRIQNQAMRMMTGATKITPIRELETNTGLPTLKKWTKHQGIDKGSQIHKAS